MRTLCERRPRALPRPAAHGAGGPAAAGLAGGLSTGARRQGGPAHGRGQRAPRGGRDGGGDRRAPGSDARWGDPTDRFYRAIERDDPGAPGGVGAAEAVARLLSGDGGGGAVAGGLRRQRVRRPRGAPPAARGLRADVARPDPRHGGGIDRSDLDGGRGAGVPRAPDPAHRPPGATARAALIARDDPLPARPLPRTVGAAGEAGGVITRPCGHTAETP